MEVKTENARFDLAAKRRRSRVASLPTSSLFSTNKRGSLVPAKAPQESIRTIYTSRAIKEYRQRRAIHHKRLRKEQDKNKVKQDLAVVEVKAIDRFRRIVQLVMTLRKAFANIVSYASEKGKYERVNSETTLSLKSTAAAKIAVENLLFDPEDYKCHYQITLPHWARDLANTPPDMRTQAEVKMLVRLMRQLKSFRRYSSEMQFALSQALRYDSFARRRVIIRKGHVAQRFYFIYSGSVCVTVDDDEHSAFAKPTENAVLSRGDFFGELAFLRNLRRSATIVCLEKTELLSVDKEDFFAANIDKCFSRDMEKRVDFLSNHPLFATWPQPIVRELAEVSRIHEYHSEEVLVRDSTDSSWLVLVTKGQCDVLRLLDLSGCPEYVSHCNKYRAALIHDRTSSQYSPNFDRFSPNPLLIRGIPVENDEDAPDGISNSRSENKLHTTKAIRDSTENQSRCRTMSALPLASRAHPVCTTRGSPVWGSAVGQSKLATQVTSAEKEDRRLIARTADDGVGVGVYMVLDRLRAGLCFGAWSILQQEETKTRVNKAVPKLRRFTLLSGGCEVIKVSKEGLMKYADSATISKLRQMTRDYPSDGRLCHTYLKHSDWRTYREELVDNLVVRHISRQEAAKGSWRTHSVRSSPVPSPLCSLKPWQPANSTWERFPRAGWVSSKVVEPLIEAGQHKSPRHTAPSTAALTPDSTPRASIQYPVTRHTPVYPQAPVGRGSRPVSTITRPPTSSLPHPEKLLPLVRNELVLARGSHRALVLTHGGARCNEAQKEVERRILGTPGANIHLGLRQTSN